MLYINIIFKFYNLLNIRYQGGGNYYTFSLTANIGINSLTDVVSCSMTGLATLTPNLLHCSIKYLGLQ
jgi:hypothetical protein